MRIFSAKKMGDCRKKGEAGHLADYIRGETLLCVRQSPLIKTNMVSLFGAVWTMETDRSVEGALCDVYVWRCRLDGSQPAGSGEHTAAAKPVVVWREHDHSTGQLSHHHAR